MNYCERWNGEVGTYATVPRADTRLPSGCLQHRCRVEIGMADDARLQADAPTRQVAMVAEDDAAERRSIYGRRGGVSPIAAAVRRSWIYSWARVAEWGRRARSRRKLMALDDRQLSDIGLTRIDAARESRKRFWQT